MADSKENDFQIDAVKLMREQRDKLSEKYTNNPELEEEDLKKIRGKYTSELPPVKEVY